MNSPCEDMEIIEQPKATEKIGMHGPLFIKSAPLLL